MTIRIAVATMALGASFLIASDAPAKGQAAPARGGEELAVLAKSAKSASDHLKVASQYETRAREFEAKAKEHEANADRLAKRGTHFPLAHKWPAMAQGPIDRERAKAMQARRAAKESSDLAAKHKALARQGAVRADE